MAECCSKRTTYYPTRYAVGRPCYVTQSGGQRSSCAKAAFCVQARSCGTYRSRGPRKRRAQPAKYCKLS